MIKVIEGDIFKQNDIQADITIADPPYDYSDSQKKLLLHILRQITTRLIFIYGTPENQYPEPDQYIFWIKPTSPKANKYSYLRRVEIVHVYGKMELPANLHYAQRDNVWTDPVDRKDLHPHRKPPDQVRRILEHHAREGDTIFEPFRGSAPVEQVVREWHGTNRLINYVGLDCPKCRKIRKEKADEQK